MIRESHKAHTGGEITQQAIFGSRLLLVPLYLGLIVALVVYALKFFQEIYELILHGLKMDEFEILLAVLSLLDITMIANLIVMILIGSYATFVAELKFEEGAPRPQWLNHISAGILKVKMGSSIVGVSSIHLLKVFINSEHSTWDEVWKKVVIHALFVASTYILFVISKNDVPTHSDVVSTEKPNENHSDSAHHTA